MKILIQSIALVFVTGAFGMASAQSSDIPSRGPIPFNTYDSDGDGGISEPEFDAAHAKRLENRAKEGLAVRNTPSTAAFGELDLNGDGQLNQDELLSGQKAQMLKRSAMMEPGKLPGNGKGYLPTFAEFDLNSDGILLEDEYIEARSKRVNERKKQGFYMRGLGKGQPYSEIDINGDDMVTPEEFATAESMRNGNGTK